LFRHCLSPSQESIEGGTIHQFAADNDGAYPLRVVNVIERIRVEKDHIRELANLDRARVFAFIEQR